MTEDQYTPRGEAGAGWTRIGQWDTAQRRSLWSRLTTDDKEPAILDVSTVLKIELCAGREGDDAYVAVTPENPCFKDLLDIVLYAEGNLPEPEPDVLLENQEPLELFTIESQDARGQWGIEDHFRDRLLGEDQLLWLRQHYPDREFRFVCYSPAGGRLG